MGLWKRGTTTLAKFTEQISVMKTHSRKPTKPWSWIHTTRAPKLLETI